tara:strand:- start:8641 stop:9510 length:870 start_codon:yes stop_codon:yes gene_type:complete
MAVVVSEKLNGTKSGNINAESGIRTLTKTYIVESNTSATLTLQGAMSALEDVVPIFSEIDVGYEFRANTTLAVTCKYYGTKSWKLIEGTDNAYEFELTFTNATNGGAAIPDDNDTSGEIEYVTTQGDVNGTTKSVWRANPVIGDTDNPPKNIDIGGDKIDAGGTPTSITWVNWRFTTTVKFYEFPPLNTYAYLIGKRNQSSYEGAGEGQVLYLGFSWGKDGASGLWSVTHNFAVDKEQYHMEQVCSTDPDGKPILIKGSEQGEEEYHAKHVYFIQPFEKASFGGVLPDF